MKVEEADIVIVMTNVPDRATASRLAALLVEQRHAACVNILAECTSVYRWQGKVETTTEVPLLVKTSSAAYSRVEEIIRANHPYELPEIVGIPVAHGLPAYLEWVSAQSGAVPAQ
ncbi:MAG: divalent-cation tolerance protein CutA [Betaproteobacteria bacterium]